MIHFNIYRNYFWWFVLGFFIATIVGTQTHELGHIAVAESLGYETELYYASMSYNHEGFYDDADVKAWRKMFDELGAYENFTEAQKEASNLLFKKIEQKYPTNSKHSFYITLGGPAQTFLTSFIGLFLLAFRKTNRQEDFKLLDWIAIFMSLFILREVFNTVMASASYFIKGTAYFTGDEFRISRYLELNSWTIPIFTAIIGFMIASFVIFLIVPKKVRFTFIAAGFVGSIVGFVLWFYVLGPFLFV